MEISSQGSDDLFQTTTSAELDQSGGMVGNI